MKTKKGFTLIELLVVVAIIGILASVVIGALSNARGKARDSQRLSDIHQLQNALELYANDHGGNYPVTVINGQLSALNILVTEGDMPKLINDPLNTGTTPTWTWSNQNTYYYWGTGNVGTCGPYGYTLWYRLENNSNGNAESCVHLDANSFTKHP